MAHPTSAGETEPHVSRTHLLPLAGLALALACGGEPPPAPAAQPLAYSPGPAASLADWMPDGYSGAQGAHAALPPGHPPIGPSASHGAPSLPAGHPPTAGEEASGETVVAGTVRETMDAAGYTYMHVETSTGMRWIAGTQTTVAVGDRVHAVGTTMSGFRSNTLGRTFDQLVLASSVRTE